MGIAEGGTIRDLARANVSICFSFEPRRTKKTIEQILNERGITDPNLRQACQEEADRMVEQRVLYIRKDRINYVFSKDDQGTYSLQPATRLDVLRYHLKRLLN